LKNLDDDLSRLIVLLMDTGMRVNEACGLRWGDVVINDDIAFIRLHKNPFRRLKTKNSERFIPLVGLALTKLSNAKRCSAEWVFPRYINLDRKETKNDTASASSNKRIRSILDAGSATCHGFRHTMTTRLRNVECPEDVRKVRKECLGWVASISAQYGTSTDMHTKTDYYNQAYKLKDW